MRSGTGELRMDVRTELGPAATCLCHLAAVAMHGTAARALFECH